MYVTKMAITRLGGNWKPKEGSLITFWLENTYRNLRLYLLSSMCVCTYIIVNGGGTRNVIFILPHFEIWHVKCSCFSFSGYFGVSFFFFFFFKKSDLGGRGSLWNTEQQTLTCIVVCISVAKHTAQPWHQPHFVHFMGNNVVYLMIITMHVFSQNCTHSSYILLYLLRRF